MQHFFFFFFFTYLRLKFTDRIILEMFSNSTKYKYFCIHRTEPRVNMYSYMRPANAEYNDFRVHWQWRSKGEGVGGWRHLYRGGARCSSVVRAFAHGAMGSRIYPSWWTHWAISRSSQCSMTGGMCYPVCGMVHIKEPLLLRGKSSLCGGSGFPFSLSEWSFTICLTPYNRK